MPLPDTYLDYPDRKHGMDTPHLDWTPLPDRAPARLADGTRLALTFVVPLEFFPLNPPAAPFKHPGAMKTPYPDLRHYTVRDYGNRVGVYRLLEMFSRLGAKATFAINAEVARRYPPLIDAILQGGHEIAAHGLSTAHIHHGGMDDAVERRWIQETREVFPQAVTWLSPARNQSFSTVDLLAAEGFSVCLDWEADQRPVGLKTRHGIVAAIPNANELSDFRLLGERFQTEAEWQSQIVEAVAYSVSRFEPEGSASLALTLTPYIAGQPFRIRAVSDLVSSLTSTDGVRIMTARENAELFGFQVNAPE